MSYCMNLITKLGNLKKGFLGGVHHSPSFIIIKRRMLRSIVSKSPDRVGSHGRTKDVFQMEHNGTLIVPY